jgi:hypothetical protein
MRDRCGGRVDRNTNPSALPLKTMYIYLLDSELLYALSHSGAHLLPSLSFTVSDYDSESFILCSSTRLSWPTEQAECIHDVECGTCQQ